MNGYDEYLMTEITRIFKATFQNDKKYEFDALFGSFLRKDDLNYADERAWARFERICKQLTELEAYSVIVRFMAGVFTKSNDYDMVRIGKVLEEVSVTEEIKLSDLCAEFFVYSKIIEENFDTSKESKESAMKEAITEAKGLYSKDISKYYRVNTYSPRILVEILPEYICARVYGHPIDMEELDLEELEQLVSDVVEKRKSYFNEEFQWIDEKNAEIRALEKDNPEEHFPKLVKEKVSYYDLHCVVPGFVLPIFKATEVIGKKKMCYEILHRYVLKVFSETPWEYRFRPELPIMVSLLASYADFIFSLVMHDAKLSMTTFTSTYNSDQFLEEMIGKNQGIFISTGQCLYKDYPEIGTMFAQIIDRGKGYIKPIMPQYLYSFLIAQTAFMLYCTEQKEMAVDHLLKNFDDIDVADRRKLYFQVTLVRCILDCNQLEAANSLYGYFNYEMNRKELESESIFTTIDSMIQFLDDAKIYIRLKEEYTFETKESWYDILYMDGKIDAIVEEIREINQKKIMIEESKFRQLFRIVEAYSHQSGINLSLLGLPCYDNYDKLPQALSRNLQLCAQGLVDKWDEYKAFFLSKNQLRVQQDTNIFLQHRLSKLVKNSIEESIQKITVLKSQYSDLEEESEEGQAFERELDEICQELSVKMQCYGSGRSEILNYICDLHDRFVTKYCPGCGELGLLQKLPDDIKNKVIDCLATSEIVYRILSVRSDVNELDFSASLISLTKVVEMILNYIYSKMNVTYDATLDSKVLSSYFWNGTRKDHIEFGPGIYLFKDAKRIRVKSVTNNLLENVNVYPRKHFQLWNGNAVVDISKLKKYKDIDIRVDQTVNGQTNVAIMNFKQDDNHNRMLLALGLEFIKDNYRNVGAHGEKFGLAKLKEVRELLILTENMVWILLDILR